MYDNDDFRYLDWIKEKCGIRLQGQVSDCKVAALHSAFIDYSRYFSYEKMCGESKNYRTCEGENTTIENFHIDRFRMLEMDRLTSVAIV